LFRDQRGEQQALSTVDIDGTAGAFGETQHSTAARLTRCFSAYNRLGCL
jgi:hypothetical protein